MKDKSWKQKPFNIKESNWRLTFIMSIGIILIVIIFGTIQNKKLVKEIVSYKKMTIGKITYYHHHYKSGTYLKYEYRIGQDTFGEWRSTPFSENKIFIGKEFPLIYDSTNIAKHHLLLTPKEFEQYEIIFPDSLSWIKKYVSVF